MGNYLKAMEKRLAEDQRDLLQRIWAPTVVATPLTDSRRDVCILPDGEIRAYGMLYATKEFGQEGQTAYLSSTDCGLSWSLRYGYGKMNSCTYLEKGGVYLSSCDRLHNNRGIKTGLYVYRSFIGPDDPDPEVIKLSDELYEASFLPKQSAYSDRVWFSSQLNSAPEFFFSDDLGRTWNRRQIPDPRTFEPVFPHKGTRWLYNSNTEPNVIEVSENHMLMILRTPMDCFWKSESFDGGDTWTAPEPTDFYGTNTTAYLLTLSDGKVLNFWNNTRPLAQPNVSRLPDTPEYWFEKLGANTFTNRDAAHVAVSEDGGKTFLGYRELILNPVRNNADFRYLGGVISSADKSVHQFQAFELPYGKILVSAGQNQASRRLVIFDIGWLYETERTEDFLTGTGNVTTHTYLKSISGSHFREVGNGHCAWNRTYSAVPMPDPAGSFAEVLSVSKHHDERLINDIGGVTWNFPAAKQGRVSVEILITEKNARFILSDRWYNTCDPYAAVQSPFWFELDTVDTGTGWCRVDVDFDTEAGMAEVFVGGENLFKVKMTTPCPVGLSYLILQCAADGDSKGFYIRKLEKR